MKWIQKRSVLFVLSIILTVVLLSACGSSNNNQASNNQGSNDENSNDSEKVEVTEIKMAYPSTPDFTDVASLLVWDNPPEGLKVNYEFMAKADIAIQGVVQGNFDIGAAPAITVLSAIDSGMPIKIFAEQMKNEFALLTPSTITKPEDLQGKVMAIHGPNTLTDALVRSTIQKYGLDKAKVLTIPGSEVRAQALMKGEIDATPAEISDVINVRKTAGDKFHILAAYPQEYPLVNGTVFFTTDKFLNENPEKVKLFTKAILEGYRKVYEDPNFLKQNATKHLKEMDQETINELADTYLENKVLDVNGGISKEGGEFTINFNKEMGLLKSDTVTFDKVYNVSIVEEVLKEIGKK